MDFSSYAAPPARQASATDCLPVWGADQAANQADFDLPLTAFFRRHSARVEASVIAAALTGVAAFLLPFLLAR